VLAPVVVCRFAALIEAGSCSGVVDVGVGVSLAIVSSRSIDDLD